MLRKGYYLALFRAADVQKRGNIGGADAVKFFGRSKLPVDVLKNIWTVSDQPSTSSLDLKKFAVAVRLIQLTQNGQKGKGANLETPPGVVLKPVFFEGVSGVSVQMPPPPPQQGGMPPPQPTPQQPNRAMPAPSGPASVPPSPKMNRPPPTPMSPSRALVGMDPYTLSPQERQRYESLFPNYAKTEADGSQFVYGSEAVPLFMKSGVDPNKLRDIWNMVDRNPVDNRLDKLEFALAMHLIVCVSKKNLPLPTGGALPNSLQALKAAASGAEAPAPPPQEQPIQLPPPQAETTKAPPTPGMGAGGPPPVVGSSSMGGMNISDAFEGMSAIGSVTDYSHAPEPEAPPAPAPAPALPTYVPEAPIPAPAPVVVEPATPQPQPTYVQPVQMPEPAIIPPAAAPTPPAPAPTYEVSDSQHDELAKLKNALQNLQAENVSLKAQLGNMTEEEKHVQQELGQTMAEITSLTENLKLTRQEVAEAKNRLLEAKAALNAQKEKKGVLSGQISEAKETAEAIDFARESVEATTMQSAPPAPAPEPAANFFDMGYSNPVGGPPPAAETPAMPPQGGMEGFGQPMTGGVASMPTPQPARDTVAPESAPQEQQQLSIPEPPAAEQYANYAAPMAGGYGAPVPMPPQQETGGYPAPAPAPQQQEMGGYPAPAPPQQEMGGYPAPAPMPPQQEMGGYPAPAPMPPQQEMGGYPAPAPAAGVYGAPAPMPPVQEGYPAQAQMPPQQGYGAPAPMPPPQQTPIQHRRAAAPGHVRNSSGFDGDFLMGGSAQALPQDTSRDGDDISRAAHSVASNGDYGYDDQAFEIVENMKKKAKKADSVARDAEAAHRKLAAEADELRTDADRAQANARSLAAQAAPDEKKKKGRFGGGGKKKEKKQKEVAEQASRDAAQIKRHFMAIQGQAMEAQTVAAQTRAEADRLRDEAESAELEMAAAASKKQKQPSAPVPAPAPVAPQQGGYSNASPVPNYGAPPQQQQYGMPNGGQPMMPPNGGGYNNYMNNGYGQYPPQQQQYGAPQQMSYPPKPEMGNGAYGGYGQQMAPAPGGDQYVSPF